jgi:flagellar protein FlbD
MIALKRLNGQEFILNADLIETLESTPDSIITLSNGKKLMVKNTLEEIVLKTLKYKQMCNTSVQIVHRDDPGDVGHRPQDVIK